MHTLRNIVVFALVSGCLSVPRAAEVVRDVVYRTAGSQRLSLDVFKPEVTTAPCPVILMIHSGGWIHGDKSSQEHFGVALANAGFVAIGANYRLAPESMYPKPVSDCQAALKWVRRHAEDFGGDPHRIGLLGESAGAQLASLVGLLDARNTRERAKQMPVRAVANLLGPTDLASWWDFAPSQTYLLPLFGGSPAQKAKSYMRASPRYQVSAYAPAFLNLYGTADTLIPLNQGTDFHAALSSAGADSTLVLMQGADHYWPPDSDFAAQEKNALMQFFITRLAPQ